MGICLPARSASVWSSGNVAEQDLALATVGSAASPVGADQAESAYLLAQKAQVAATTYQVDKAGFHVIEDSSKAGSIPATALGDVRNARIAVQSTAWPESLKSMSSDLVTAMMSLEEAIRTEDAAKVVDPATKSHQVGHDLSATVYTWLDTGRAPEGGHGH
jgi:hypothetical protein